MRCPLSSLLTAAMGTAALSLMSAQCLAQGAQGKPKSPAPPPVKSPAPAVAPPSASGDESVVGICNGHKITWGQLVAKIRQDQPNLIDQSISTVVATKAQETFFGAHPKDTFTITKAEAIGELRQHPNQAISQQLELMLTQMAVDEQATKENVQPTPKQVEDKVATLLKNLREAGTIPKTQTDAQFLAEHHVTLDKLKVNYRPQCQVLNLIDKNLTKKLGHPAGPDDMIQASHVLIQVKDLPPTATADDKKKADDAALARTKQLLADIRAGKITFADAAKANSDDPGTKDKGGDLGTFMRGTMVPEFDNAAFAAKTNVVTDPVKSSFGYHIILVTKTGKDIPPAERAKFIEKYETDQIQVFLQQVVEKDNKVENRLAKLVPPSAGGGPFGGPGARRPQ